MKKFSTLLILCLVLFSACKTPKDIVYLQDLQEKVPVATQPGGEIRFMRGDRLNIIVHSRDEKMKELFNIGSGSSMQIMNNSQNGGGGGYYTVDENGEIDFPVLGQVRIEGLTRIEVARQIKEQIISNGLCNDPVVVVYFSNMNFSVLGEFKGSGQKQINKDRITLIEAIAMSGDLGINGLRKNVLVVRQEGDQQVPYRVDLTDAGNVYNSPVYYVRQNDIIYVEPNDKEKRNSTVMGNTAFTPTFWMSMVSFLTTMGLLIYNLVK